MTRARKLRSQYRVRGAETVKFPRLGRGRVFLALILGTLRAGAGPTEPPLLLGGPVAEAPHVVENDPRLPTGTRWEAEPRPLGAERVCSLRAPVCVASGLAVGASLRLEALAALEHAYRALVHGLELPAPLGDFEQGGGPELDLYLAPPNRETPGFERVRVVAESRRPAGFDRAAAFCSALADDDPWLLRRAATLCVGEAIALRLDAGEAPDLRRAFATELWWLVGLPTSLDVEAIQFVQGKPSAAIAARERTAASEGRAIFLEYLEEKLGAGAPGALSTALIAASAQTTPSDSWSSDNEPDWFDVLRHTLGEGEAKMANLLGDFAVARAFLGKREDGRHLPLLAWSNDFGTARYDWTLTFKSLPRRVRLTPLEPTGAALVWLDLEGAPQNVTLAMRAEWEPPAEFQWLLVTVGKNGELGRLEVPFQERETLAEARLVNVRDARGVLVVGTHLERVDKDHPFDVDVEPFEAHGASLYVVEM